MSDGVTVDANVMKAFNQDFLENVESASRLLVEQALLRRNLVIDEGGKIKHEWFEQCHGPYFGVWFTDQLKLGRIRMVRASLQQQHRKALVNDLGFPIDGYDLVYVGVANVTATRYIVSQDMDFFDPKLKQADEAAKRRARDDRRGAVCRYLRRQMRIVVGTTAHAIEEILEPAAPA